MRPRPPKPKLAAVETAYSFLTFSAAASVWSKAGDPARAAAMLQVGLQVYPHNKDLLAALEELAIEIGIRNFSSALNPTI